jgi:hypothetical protein
VEDKTSELKGKIEVKEKTEEILVKQLKSCERNMHEFSNSIKRPNLRIMGIEDAEGVQANGIHNIINKIVTENFTNLKKFLPIQVQEASRSPNRLDQNRNSPWYINIKITCIEIKERIMKAVREKNQIMYKCKPIKITADFSMKTLKLEGHGMRYLGH